MNHRSIITTALLSVVALACSGCVSFSGPRDLQSQLERAGNITLCEEEGVCVGALAIGVANLVAGPWLPVNLAGVSTVDYGEYRIEAPYGEPDSMCFRSIELPGWEPFLRVRDGNSHMVVMVEEEGNSVRTMLFIQQEGNALEVVRARGDFERILDNIMSSQFLDGLGYEAMLMGLSEEWPTPKPTTTGGSH